MDKNGKVDFQSFSKGFEVLCKKLGKFPLFLYTSKASPSSTSSSSTSKFLSVQFNTSPVTFNTSSISKTGKSTFSLPLPLAPATLPQLNHVNDATVTRQMVHQETRTITSSTQQGNYQHTNGHLKNDEKAAHISKFPLPSVTTTSKQKMRPFFFFF